MGPYRLWRRLCILFLMLWNITESLITNSRKEYRRGHFQVLTLKEVILSREEPFSNSPLPHEAKFWGYKSKLPSAVSLVKMKNP